MVTVQLKNNLKENNKYITLITFLGIEYFKTPEEKALSLWLFGFQLTLKW